MSCSNKFIYGSLLMQSLIYADHAATTALSLSAFEAMKPWLQDKYGNPSTLYRLAIEPRKAIATARETIASAIGALPEEIFFTSGGSESDNWAIKGTAFQHAPCVKIITSCIEHHAVLNSCASLARMGFRITELAVNHEGIVSPDELKEELSSDTVLVTVMLANNEIGTIEPIKELASCAHEKGCVFHTDAVQATGHIPINVNDLGVDMLSASAHKFNGPKGVGFLYIRSGTNLIPLIDGGGQEHGLRSGTENVAGIVGMAVALQEHIEHMDEETAFLQELSQRMVRELKNRNLDFIINGSKNRIPGSLSISFRGAEGETLLHRLDLMGTAVATGSACNSKDTVLSHVLRSIGISHEYAQGTVRVTFGMDNSTEDVCRIADQIKKVLNR